MDHQRNHHFLHKMAKRDYTTIDGTVYSVDYVTPTPTFTGVVGGYSTGSVSVTQTQSSDSNNPTQSSDSSSSDDNTSSSSSSFSSATSSNTPAPSYTAGSITANSLPSSSTTSSMSSGGKIGIAVVIVLVIGGILAAALFYTSRKKKQIQAEQAREDAEKNDAAAAARHESFVKSQTEDAPKLTLRPASSFLPDLMSAGKRKSRLSAGNLLGLSSANNPVRQQYLAAIGKGQDIPMSEKSPNTENPFKDPENPFADPVKQEVPTSGPTKSHSTSSASSSSTSDSESHSGSFAAEAKKTADATPGVVQISDSEIQSVLTKGQQRGPVEMPSAPVLAPLQPRRSAITPGSTADGGVYRILMDFNPSMEDELELKAGQVVRMLHEYDDGWCLATRLDRSHQGVVPRTCLAAKPSKPRPQQGSRPASPAIRNSPPASRSMSPANGPRSVASQSGASNPANNQSVSPGAYNQPPRPLSPGPRSQQKRSMSPGPVAPPQIDVNQRRRSKSASARAVQDRRASPPGPSKLGPGVPGMAM